MGKTVRIEISEKQYLALQNMAKQASSSVSGVLEKLVEDILPEGRVLIEDYTKDPLYLMEGSFNSNLGDLSLHHDKYLYGE